MMRAMHPTISRERGITIVDGPTAATEDSDYQRLSTVRIVTEYTNRIRTVLTPYIGRASSGLMRTAMQTAVDQVGAEMITEGKVQRVSASITATALQQVRGEATLEVQLVPAFELRKIYITLALAAV